jgi:hypothetical protein
VRACMLPSFADFWSYKHGLFLLSCMHTCGRTVSTAAVAGPPPSWLVPCQVLKDRVGMLEGTVSIVSQLGQRVHECRWVRVNARLTQPTRCVNILHHD